MKTETIESQELYSEHTALPWKAHDMETNVIVSKDSDGFGRAIIETQAPIPSLDPHGIEAEGTRAFVLQATRKYYAGERLRAAASAFWSDTDTRSDDEKHSALLAAIVEYDNA